MEQNKIIKNQHIFSSLLTIAKSDGVVHEKEKNVLYKLGASYGFSITEIEKLINSDTVTIPEKLTFSGFEKSRYIMDFIRIAITDGEININEEKTIKKQINNLGVSESETDELISMAQEELQRIHQIVL
ncbi:MAG: hypothetical protein IPO21_20585 [Bacteroidales bacterium]|nr:hypothetical protein [Bacteroidales bacterium]